jgi:hypothetical protein
MPLVDKAFDIASSSIATAILLPIFVTFIGTTSFSDVDVVDDDSNDSPCTALGEKRLPACPCPH